MATPGMMSTLHAGENTKRPLAVGKTGKQLPVWFMAGVKALLREVPSLPTCPAGYMVSIDDIIRSTSTEISSPFLSLSQYEFTAYRNVPAFLIGHHFPLFLVGESPDIRFIQLLIRNGMADQSTHTATISDAGASRRFDDEGLN